MRDSTTFAIASVRIAESDSSSTHIVPQEGNGSTFARCSRNGQEKEQREEQPWKRIINLDGSRHLFHIDFLCPIFLPATRKRRAFTSCGTMWVEDQITAIRNGKALRSMESRTPDEVLYRFGLWRRLREISQACFTLMRRKLPVISIRNSMIRRNFPTGRSHLEADDIKQLKKCEAGKCDSAAYRSEWPFKQSVNWSVLAANQANS